MQAASTLGSTINIVAIAFAIIVSLVLAALYLLSRVRRNDIDVLRSSNQDLRDAIDDKGKELTQMHQDFAILRERVNELEKRNKTLEDLVVVALKQYFFENPIVAKSIDNVVKVSE